MIRQIWPDEELLMREMVARRRINPSITDAEVANFVATHARYQSEDVAFQRGFRRMLFAEPALKGRVLEIGAGGFVAPAIYRVHEICSQLDGVDPDPAILHHPHLTERWNTTFEEAELPEAAYDLAYSYNVVEHVPNARAFFEKLSRVLKSSGVFWTLTPHARHPFSIATRIVQAVGAKKFAHRIQPLANEYPAYYRLNSRRAILRAIDGLGFGAAQFHYFDAAWTVYVPRILHFVPRAYDSFLASRFEQLRLILAYRLQKD